MRVLRGLLEGILKLASFAALLAFVLKMFFVDVFVMPHNGMAPTLIYGDRILVWRRAKPDMGDIVLCDHPSKPEASVIGRAVAFAGHTISVDPRGQLMVDDDAATIEGEGDVRFFDSTREKSFNMKLATIDYRRKHRHEFFVEQDHTFDMPSRTVEKGMFLLGDNRMDSWDDSREFGEVDPATCHGEIFLRLAPAPDRGDDIHHGYLDYLH
jgi:signal peptidase I